MIPEGEKRLNDLKAFNSSKKIKTEFTRARIEHVFKSGIPCILQVLHGLQALPRADLETQAQPDIALVIPDCH